MNGLHGNQCNYSRLTMMTKCSMTMSNYDIVVTMSSCIRCSTHFMMTSSSSVNENLVCWYKSTLLSSSSANEPLGLFALGNDDKLRCDDIIGCCTQHRHDTINCIVKVVVMIKSLSSNVNENLICRHRIALDNDNKLDL